MMIEITVDSLQIAYNRGLITTQEFSDMVDFYDTTVDELNMAERNVVQSILGTYGMDEMDEPLDCLEVNCIHSEEELREAMEMYLEERDMPGGEATD